MIILASNSPRRKQLLAFGGWSFQVSPVDIDEGVRVGEKPDDYVLRLSREKAQAARLSLSQPVQSMDVIVSADTSVVLNINHDNWEAVQSLPEFIQYGNQTATSQLILGKPSDEKHAEQILRLLRNQTHQVYTGISVMRIADGEMQSMLVATDVPMRDYSDSEMHAYIISGDPFDKAGAYAIQHRDFHPAQELHGCYANVMGLPVCHLAIMLRKFNLDIQLDIAENCLETFDYSCPISKQVLESNE